MNKKRLLENRTFLQIIFKFDKIDKMTPTKHKEY